MQALAIGSASFRSHPNGARSVQTSSNRSNPGMLFAAMLREFSPIETLVATLQQLAEEPPDRAMPALAVSIWGAVSTHLGVIRPLLFEA